MRIFRGQHFAALWLAVAVASPLRGQPDDGLRLARDVQQLPFALQGPFVRTSDGAILAIDESSSYLSHNEGATWSAPRPLFPAPAPVKVSRERALLRTASGTIIAGFMNLNERHWTWNDDLGDAPGARLPTYVMRSVDEGRSWQDLQQLHEDWSGAVRDIIQTRDGRVIMTAMKMLHDPGRHAVLTYSSVDEGVTWKASNLIDLGGAGHHGGVTEPTLVELSDGRIWMLIRTNWGEFWSAYSYDGGEFWRVIQPSGIAASSAPAIVKRLSSGRLLLIWNRPWPEGENEWPLSGGDRRWSATPVSNHREELSVAFSDDDGVSWSEPVVIAGRHATAKPGSGRWLAYPYAFEARPGQIWITTMQGGLRASLNELDFVNDN
jgi:sialidase-1